MKSKKSIYILLTIALVAVVGAIWYSRARLPKPEVVPQDINQNTAGQTTIATTNNGLFWEGTLKASDNTKKGNLMLTTDKTTIYINTSRDYSALIGKQVKISYQGTVDSFALEDIVGN